MNNVTPHKKTLTSILTISLMASALGFAGCNKGNNGQEIGAAASGAAPGSAVAPASVPLASAPVSASAVDAAYRPMTADQLYQLVAPVALYPDNLVAQVLAGSTYPDQITAANNWASQHTELRGAALQEAADQQPWDVSVKSLTAFPVVLKQMATNIQWTTALGRAYANDSNDVMNSIQVMRARAYECGNLKSSPQLKVVRAPASPVPAAGPVVVAPPPQTIVIEPAEPAVVYVPVYNPTVVYGAPLVLYPGYVYEPYGVVVTTGVISFGVGIAIGAFIGGHYGWGWHSWGMNWGGRYHGGWHGPAVMYNHAAYGTGAGARSTLHEAHAEGVESHAARERGVERSGSYERHEASWRGAGFHGFAHFGHFGGGHGGGGGHEERRR